MIIIFPVQVKDDVDENDDDENDDDDNDDDNNDNADYDDDDCSGVVFDESSEVSGDLKVNYIIGEDGDSSLEVSHRETEIRKKDRDRQKETDRKRDTERERQKER